MTEHLQINDVAPRVAYLADGVQTAFTFPFAVFKVDDLQVWVEGVRQGSGFSLSGVGITLGGVVLFDVPPSAGSRVVLRRRMTLERTSDFQADGIIRAKTLNDELDYQVAAVQQVADDVSRCIQRSFTSGSSADLTLPEPAGGRAIKWSADGSALVNSDEDPDVSVDAAKAAARSAQASAQAAAVGAASVAGVVAQASDWAVGTSSRGTIGGGSAKDWATLIDQPVDGSEYSAKKYAQDAASSAGNTIRGLAAERAPANWLLGEAAYLNLSDIVTALALPMVGCTRVRGALAAAASALTLTADELVVKGALGSPLAAILGGYAKTVSLTLAGAGGMDTGAAPASGYVSIYAIAGPAGASILATNAATSSGPVYTGANMPDGYAMSSLLAIWPTNGSGQMVAGVLTDRVFTYSTPAIFTLSSTSATYTSLSLATAIPAAARSVAIRANNNGNGYAAASPDGVADHLIAQAAQDYAVSAVIPINTAQTVYRRNSIAGAYLGVLGYGW